MTGTAVGLWLLLSACSGADTPEHAAPTATSQLNVPTRIVATATPVDQASAEAIAAVPPSPTPSTDVDSGYPAPSSPTVAPLPSAYPIETETPRPLITVTSAAYPPPNGEDDGTTFLPIITGPTDPTETPTPAPTKTPTPSPTPIPTVDFAAVQADLQANGQALAYSKIGFHIGVGGRQDGLFEWMERQTEAGAPFFLKSVSDAGPLAEAQKMIAESGVPHVLVFRVSGDAYDTPNYDLPPAEAARQHWDLHLAVWPPELDPSLVWIETINEVDKNRAEWLGQFALETAALAERDGYKWAAFGWSSGEPEPDQWQTPSMLQFLRLAGNNPDRLAIALHEYSYTVDEIGDAYPFKVGRFQRLLEIADANGIPRPTILITEWGWEYQNNPPLERAMSDIAWAAELYAAYPEVKGAAIWYLGPGFGSIANQTQRLIEPVMVYNLTNYFAISPVIGPVAPDNYRP